MVIFHNFLNCNVDGMPLHAATHTSTHSPFPNGPLYVNTFVYARIWNDQTTMTQTKKKKRIVPKNAYVLLFLWISSFLLYCSAISSSTISLCPASLFSTFRFDIRFFLHKFVIPFRQTNCKSIKSKKNTMCIKDFFCVLVFGSLDSMCSEKIWQTDQNVLRKQSTHS